MLPSERLVGRSTSVEQEFLVGLRGISTIVSSFAVATTSEMVDLPVRGGAVRGSLVSFLLERVSLRSGCTLFRYVRGSRPRFGCTSVP